MLLKRLYRKLTDLPVVRRIRRNLPQYATIGPYRIRLPRGSFLLEYRAASRRYDMALGEIAAAIRDKYADLRAIDVGANVGDTAALIRSHVQIPVLCIEGDPSIVQVLRKNAAALGPAIEIAPHFVGPENLSIDFGKADKRGLNATLVRGVTESGGTPLRSLEAISAEHDDFWGAKLLKIDAEGFDFDIIRSSTAFLARAKPVIFFEYYPSLQPSKPAAGLATLETLADLGYTDFLYFDNFGHFLVHLKADENDKMHELHSYLASHQRYGVIIPYFDICAFHADDVDLAREIRSRQLNHLAAVE